MRFKALNRSPSAPCVATRMVRLDSNENPNGPGAQAIAAITQHFAGSNRYPVKEPQDLVAIIAKLHGVAPANVILGCGSGELLSVMGEALRKRRHGTGRSSGQSWYADETYLKVHGRWCYLYRAIDRDGNLIDTMLSPTRDMKAA